MQGIEHVLKNMLDGGQTDDLIKGVFEAGLGGVNLPEVA
jgi:hypothetical protein